MSHIKQIKQAFGLVLVVLLLAGCGGSPAAPAATSTPAAPAVTPTPAAPALPTPGKWAGTAEFGTLTLTVNPKGTGVTYVNYTFDNYNCGNASHSGSIGNGQETGWEGNPIVNGQFTFEGATMKLSGTFDPSGTSASGTWDWPECGKTGTWKATPMK